MGLHITISQAAYQAVVQAVEEAVVEAVVEECLQALKAVLTGSDVACRCRRYPECGSLAQHRMG